MPSGGRAPAPLGMPGFTGARSPSGIVDELLGPVLLGCVADLAEQHDVGGSRVAIPVPPRSHHGDVGLRPPVAPRRDGLLLADPVLVRGQKRPQGVGQGVNRLVVRRVLGHFV